ncbi:hypothetical protein RRX38_21825 [Pseudomonas sp. DTU_2021_1001937_2_SI_NGA_ILE_001]|uniref:hypothetical protein n=1 Tax=Pseudomonas sp. DTU_2021_1001937_2_SI_NGA_ILE_001 TaxID=3077589 RepID=UPI0028FC3358|nr:hypothetical protein [Pseudomonas sp. DTU_2021_1001937_2_SI_NGA_ILE_001]WNW13686.1 hypothetical protein RRX38_21825 [Pseudomonas sp. DTU_2021_1001937_2_SI_NGA_ILE_001]
MINLTAQISTAAQLNSANLQRSVSEAATDSREQTAESASPAPAAGVQVSLSSASIQKAAEERKANPNKDIDESGLPDNAKDLLKAIRELKQKIAEKQQEIQAMMADQNMDPELKKTRVGALQAEMAALTASLMSASASLNKLQTNGTLTKSDSQKVSSLLMK